VRGKGRAEMGLLNYQFSEYSNGDVVSSRDNRNPEELKRNYAFQEKEEGEYLKKSREIADEIIQFSNSASLHGMRVAGERYSCPVLEVCNPNSSKFALLGEQCYPVKMRQGEYVLDLYNSVGVAQKAVELCRVIKRSLHYGFSYRFL